MLVTQAEPQEAELGVKVLMLLGHVASDEGPACRDRAKITLDSVLGARTAK